MCGQATIPSATFQIEQLTGIIRQTLSDRLSVPAASLEVAALRSTGEVRDDPFKLLVRRDDGRPLSVLLCSNPAAPGLIARAADRIQAVRSVLTPHLAAVVLAPLAQGSVDGLSWMLLPYCRPLPRGGLAWRFRRALLGRPILDWLAAAARATYRPVAADQLAARVERPLEHLATLSHVSENVRRSARHALCQLREGLWQPCLGLVHNDLWRDNVLLPARDNPLLADPPAPFYLIDWGGAALEGAPMYDLVRFARSWRLTKWRLRREAHRHAQITRAPASHCMHHLVLGLGQLALTLEHFPVERFAQLADECCASLGAALAVASS